MNINNYILVKYLSFNVNINIHHNEYYIFLREGITLSMLDKSIKFIIFSSLIFFILSSVSITQAINSNTSELENKKLELELNKLSYEQQYFKLSFWIQTLGIFLGGVAVLWTVISGFRAISESNKERSLTKISTLLESLSSESEYVRLAATRGLTPYIDKTTDEMLTAVAIEKSDLVRTSMETALFKAKKGNIKKIIEANTETLRERAYLYGRLIKCGVKQEQILARCRLSTESSKILQKIYHVDKEYGEKIQELLIKRNDTIECNGNSLNGDNINFLYNKMKMNSQIAESTGKVISKWIVDEHKVTWPETGLDLSETNLYKCNLENKNILYSVFSFCIMRHSNLKGSTLKNSILSNADLYDSCLDLANVQNCYLNCNLRNSSGKKINISESHLDDTIFSVATYTGAKFVDSSGKNVKFRATVLINSFFYKCHLIQAEFHDAKLEGAILNECKMYSSIFVEANLSNTSIKDVSFNGSDFRGADFSNSTIRNCDFRGTNVKNANFKGAILENNIFDNCNIDEAVGLNKQQI